MQLNKLLKIHSEFLDDLKFKEKKPSKYSVINNAELKKSPLWTAQYFDDTYNLFWNNFEKFVKLNEIADILVGVEPGSTDYIEFFDINSKDVPFIKTSELANFEINQTSKHFISEENYKKLKQDFKRGDILYSKDGKVGQSAMVLENTRFVLGSGIVRIRIKENNFGLTNSIIFLLLSLKEFGLYFAKKYTVRGTTIPHLNIEYIQNMKIPQLDRNIIEKYNKKINELIRL